jgi:hypothetical protein
MIDLNVFKNVVLQTKANPFFKNKIRGFTLIVPKSQLIALLNSKILQFRLKIHFKHEFARPGNFVQVPDVFQSIVFLNRVDSLNERLTKTFF